jgi:hypothetical protein
MKICRLLPVSGYCVKCRARSSARPPPSGAEANRLAAVVDAGPAGPMLLAIHTGNCLCGAPFDLEATPNFKARLA